MGAYAGPDVSENGLVFCLDAKNRRGISPLGCTGFNNAPQLVKNLVSPSDIINSYGDIKLGNRDYYTAFAIDYPEGSYGGAAASRQGITPGYNVTSGDKLYDAGRALHLWVWVNSTSSWVPLNYFNGAGVSGDGHVYDSYVGTEEVDIWVNDYNNIRNTFGDDITVIAMGSHRDSYHTTAQYDILKDLGAPSDVDSIINFSSPEWILVGKPGLGAGNAYGWAFQNYSTDPTEVAHLNFGLPIYGGDDYLSFDGVDDYIVSTNNSSLSLTSQITISSWITTTSFDNYATIAMKTGSGSWVDGYGISRHPTGSKMTFWINNWDSNRVNIDWSTHSEFKNLVGTFDGSNIRLYVDGVLINSAAYSSAITTNSEPLSIGSWYNTSGSTNQHWNGNIAQVSIYNRALTASEIQQNYNALKNRFSL
jgi:hypothetical protein